jgi:hypothetical protein
MFETAAVPHLRSRDLHHLGTFYIASEARVSFDRLSAYRSLSVHDVYGPTLATACEDFL